MSRVEPKIKVYKRELSDLAKEDLDNLSDSTWQRIGSEIDKLLKQPFDPILPIQKLRCNLRRDDPVFSIRAEDSTGEHWKIIFEVDDVQETITILRVMPATQTICAEIPLDVFLDQL